MLRLLLVTILISYGCVVHTQKRPGDIVLPYKFANDSFLVRITDLSNNPTTTDTIHFVYYPDESLKSGHKMEEMIQLYQPKLLSRHFVFIGIAHFGEFRFRRRRDMIPPSIRTNQGYVGKDKNYGQADSFYHFLTHTIIPLAEEKFTKQPADRTFIGHSLGGLFATYLLVGEDTLFNNLYALSPALWIDDYHILDYEDRRQQQLKSSSKKYWVSCGGGETMNRINTGVDKMLERLRQRNYPNLYWQFKIYPGKTHESSLEPTYTDIFDAWTQ